MTDLGTGGYTLRFPLTTTLEPDMTFWFDFALTLCIVVAWVILIGESKR